MRQRIRRQRYALESDDMVTGLDVGDALANGFNYTGSFMSQNNGKSSLGILP